MDDFSDLEDDLLEMDDEPVKTSNVNGKDHYMFLNVPLSQDATK